MAQLAALDLNDRVAETDRFNRAEENLFVTEVARRGNRWRWGGAEKGEKKENKWTYKRSRCWQ